jgi:hypothetical protein
MLQGNISRNGITTSQKVDIINPSYILIDMDISIKNLKKYIFEPKTESLRLKRANEILSHNMVITEKVDGTKLTLVRTEQADKTDYTKNWIVAYKGTVLYAKEFAHLGAQEKGDISQQSVGIGQYSMIFDHLAKINGKIDSIPKSTEFSVEFAQNKDTLTRTYVNKGGLFLRSYGQVQYRVIGGELHTIPKQEITDYKSVKKMADLLEISSFPIFFQGKLTKENLLKNPLFGAKMTNADWANPADVINKFSDAILAVPSTLGGTTEGVVMKLDNGEFFKLVQADQYDAEVRGAKKDMYKLEPEAATAYFQQIRTLIQNIFAAIGTEGKSEEDIISDSNFYIAKNSAKLKKFFDALQKIAGNKKNIVQIKDDIHDTIRLMTSKQGLLGTTGNTLALIPIAGKPLHIGHWKLIEKAANENDRVIVYTSSSDRIKKGEFPIKGDDFVKLWSDVFIPSLPKNVKVKFVDSPVRAVMHELGWLEQRLTQDAANVPIINLYSDKDDVETNFKDEDLKKYPSLLSANKIKKVGVERTSTVNVSGTKMREFLMNNDKESFLKNLPPVSNKDKEEIWTTLMANKPEPVAEANPYMALAEELIQQAEAELFGEGGWRSAATQSTIITPKKVSTILSAMDEFVSAFNAYSNLPPIESNGPVGSAMYYKQDLDKNDVQYGDIDIQIVLPEETNDRTSQLASNKKYSDKIRQFIQEKKPSYIYPNFQDKDFGTGYLIFNVDNEKIQVDLVLSYKVSAEWTKIRTTPEKGLKGFVTGMLLSALSNALNVVLGSNTNPYVNTVDGKVASSLIKTNAKPVFFSPNQVFLDILKFYGNLAGVSKVNSSVLQGHYGLDENDPSLKKKCEAVVALSKALDNNRAFDQGVVVSKDGVKFKSREEFVKYVLDTFIKNMKSASTSKKLEKAATPEAMKNIEKIKRDANLGIELAKQLIREEIALLNESGQSVASVDDKTPKTVNGQPAQATTKLKIVDPQGKDIRSSVSADVKELVYALNDKVHFWKKNNPYIENGFVFNGSSQYLMSGDAKYKELAKYKSAFGDIDVIVPKEKLDAMEAYLDSIDDKQVEWKPTPNNKVSKNFYYIGRTKSQRALAGQTVTLWYYAPVKQVVQVDFEGDEMILDPQGYEKPSEWNKFIKDSPWQDLTSGIKGLAGAILLRGLTRAATALPNAVYVTNATAARIESGQLKSLIDTKGKSVVSSNVTHALPAEYTLNTSGSGHAGVRKAYRLVAKNMDYQGKKVDVYTDISASESKPEDRINSVNKVFELIFKRKPSGKDIENFRSYVGLLTLMKTLPKEVQVKALERAKEGLAQAGLDPAEYAPIQKAAKTILGISI